MDDVEVVLDREIAEIKEDVGALEHDLKALIAHEEGNQAREELLDWLRMKQEHAAMLRDPARVEDVLSHLEEAYRTAAISEKAYQEAKDANQALLER